MGLNECFIGVRSNIMLFSPLPSIGQAYSLVIQDEMQEKHMLHLFIQVNQDLLWQLTMLEEERRLMTIRDRNKFLKQRRTLAYMHTSRSLVITLINVKGYMVSQKIPN